MDHYSPRNYQKIITDFIIDKKRVAIFVKMGLGKTAATLDAIRQLEYDYYKVRRVLIVAPKRVAEMTWPDEIRKWDMSMGLTISVVAGTPQERIAALKIRADIYTIGRNNLVWLAKNHKWDFDMLVLDESTSFKRHASKRFKAISMFTPLCPYVVLLSGSPAPRGYTNLWPQFFLLDRGARRGQTITAYREKYFTYDARRFDYNLIPGCDKIIQAKVKDLSIGMNNETYLKIDKPIINDVQLPMPPGIKKVYKKFRDELLLPFEDGLGNITALNAGVLTSKLRQFASGACYDENKNIRSLHDIKIDALTEVIDGAQGESILVLYNYKHELERILQAHPDARQLKKVSDLEDWNAGKIPIAICHPASIGHGLNIQFGGHIIVWFSLTPDLELYEQSNARLARPGQTHTVIIHRLVLIGSRDEEDIKLLDKRDITQKDFLESIRVSFEKSI